MNHFKDLSFSLILGTVLDSRIIDLISVGAGLEAKQADFITEEEDMRLCMGP